MRCANRSDRQRRRLVFMLLGLWLCFPATGAGAADVSVSAASLNRGTAPAYDPEDTITVTGNQALDATGWATLKALDGGQFCLVLDNGQTEIPDAALGDVNSDPHDACQGIISITGPEVTTLGTSAFDSCQRLTTVDLPRMQTIGDSAFYGCTDLSLSELPAEVTGIGDKAFHACTHLALSELPEGVTSIGEGAFHGCVSLTSLYLPAVTSIGDWAFAGCAGLTTLQLGDSAPALEGGNVFAGLDAAGLTIVTDDTSNSPIDYPDEATYQARTPDAASGDSTVSTAAGTQPDDGSTSCDAGALGLALCGLCLWRSRRG